MTEPGDEGPADDAAPADPPAPDAADRDEAEDAGDDTVAETDGSPDADADAPSDPAAPHLQPDVAYPDEDRGAPLWARALAFVAALLLFVGLVAVVVGRDRSRSDPATAATGATARTVPLPADNGGGSSTTTTVARPTGSGPDTVARRPRTNDDIALVVEQLLRRDTGFTYKASCLPGGEARADDLLTCSVASEPVIKDAPPGSVAVVVVDDQGRFIWTHTDDDDLTLDGLRREPGLSCDDLAARSRPWAYVLAYWLANDRPTALDPSGTGRPCDGRYSSADIDRTLASASTS